MADFEWSPLLAEHYIEQVAAGMTVDMLMTHRNEWIAIGPQDTIETATERMRGYFDQLPVVDGETVHGLLLRSDIQDSATPKDLVAQHVRCGETIGVVPQRAGLDQAVEILRSNQACFVRDTTTGDYCGLLHFADLNKQAFRMYCYMWISAIEMGMADFVSRGVPNSSDWLRYLAEHRQVQVLGRLEFDRRNNVELSDVETLELSDLVKVMGSNGSLLGQLGVSKTQYEECSKKVVTFRNDIMHPVRAIIRRHEDVNQLHGRLEQVHKLRSMVLSAIQDQDHVAG